MGKNNREGYEFPRDLRLAFRKKAEGKCQFPAEECGNPNDGKVHHITGVFEARLNIMDAEAISDPELNAIMLCEDHVAQHDEQETAHLLALGKDYVPDHEIFRVQGAHSTEHLIFLNQHEQRLEDAA